jgi:hypothetical protein
MTGDEMIDGMDASAAAKTHAPRKLKNFLGGIYPIFVVG